VKKNTHEFFQRFKIFRFNIGIFFKNFSLFRCFYVVSTLFETIIFTDTVFLWVKSIILFWGFLVFFNVFFSRSKLLKINYKEIVLPFILVEIFTSFINISVDFLTNLVFVFHSIICFFVFFGAGKNTDKKSVFNEMNFIFKFILFFSGIISAAGIFILFLKPNTKIGDYTLGILNNRFVGIYTNSNLAGFVSVISIFIYDCVYYEFNNNMKKLTKVYLNLILILNMLTLFLSDSNASFVFLTVYFTVRIFCNNFFKYKSLKEAKILREALFLSVCVILMISVSILIRAVFQQTLSYFLNCVYKTSVRENISLDEIFQENSLPTSPAAEPIKIGRGNHDIGSGRITLFKQGMELFKMHPIMGIGRANLMRYGRIYIDGGLIFPDLHNSYLTILVSYGTFGFLFFVIFCASVIFRLCKSLVNARRRYEFNIFSKFFSAVISYFSYAVFEKAILSEITFMVIFFWMILGYTMIYCENFKNSANLF
jgi:hypothetical protein